MKTTSNRFLNEYQVEQEIGIQATTLRRWRLYGRGPRFRKLCGAVRYERSDLEAWIASCRAGGGAVTTGSSQPEAA